MTSVGSYWEKKMANITVKADSSLACDLRFFLLICSQQPPRDDPTHASEDSGEESDEHSPHQTTLGSHSVYMASHVWAASTSEQASANAETGVPPTSNTFSSSGLMISSASAWQKNRSSSLP